MGANLEWLLAVAALIILLAFIGRKKDSKAPAKKQYEEPRVRQAAPLPQHVPSQKPKASPAKSRWVIPGEIVEIGGIRITAGMIYVGRSLPTKHGDTENCLIDPSLRLSPGESDKLGHSMPYWPSYSDIQPKARRAYLEWLAGGRKDPEIGIGYVFLFFYGLERRYLVDGVKEDGQAIVSEVRRLLEIYGGNHSFHGYAKRFLDAATILDNPNHSRPVISPDLRNGYEMPMPVRVYLGGRLADKEPLDAEDALLWILSLPDTYLRTAATRCFDEFASLWRIRFQERHPDGLKVSAPRTRLKLEYRAASGTFDANIAITSGSQGIPDIAAVSAPLDGLRNIANACTDALDPYSRLLGRKPEARGSVEAALLLPKELSNTSSMSPLKSVVDELELLFAGRPIASVMASKLLDVLGMMPESSKTLTAAFCNQVGGMLDRLDIAFEPDRRYGSSNLAHDGRVILFKAPGGAIIDAEKVAYKSAKTMVEVSALAAWADGDIDTGEYETVKNELRSMPDLSMAERMRLLVYAGLLLKDAPRQQAVMHKLSKLSETERTNVAQSAIRSVLADGRTSPGEVKFLEKLYRALGYSADDIYAALHRGSVVIDAPIMLVPEEAAPGVKIPKKTANVPEVGIRIDSARLQRLRQETSEVSALLAEIFVEEEPPSAPPKPTTPAANTKAAFQGLDGLHADLLLAVLAAGGLDRATFEDRARELRLLPDGAIETINEWGFDTFNDPILEGDDPISVAEHLRAELEKLEKAA